MSNTIKYTPTIQVINEQGVKTPCIARIYRNGQWIQCNLHCYRLHPLISETIDEIIYDINNKPIYVAKKET